MLDGAEYFYKVGHMLSDRLVDQYAADMAEQAKKFGPVDPELRVNNPDMSAFYEAKKAERDAYAERVAEMLKEGRGISGIASAIDRSQNYVRRIIRENDLWHLRKKYDPTNNLRTAKLREERRELEKTVLPMRAKGYSLKKIAEKTGVSTFTVSRIIKDKNG